MHTLTAGTIMAVMRTGMGTITINLTLMTTIIITATMPAAKRVRTCQRRRS